MSNLSALLKKYADGTCTAEERQQVEEWLTFPPPATPGNWTTEEQEQEVKNTMWNAIHQHTLYKHTTASKRRIYIPAAAACLLLSLFLLVRGHPMLLSRKLTFTNSAGQQSQKIFAGGLQLNIQPNSTCTLEIPLFGEKARNVELCGAIAIVNTSGGKVNLNVHSDSSCKTAGMGTDQIILYKGQTYLAMTDQEFNLIAATKDELQDGLPRFFSARLSERFKL